MIGLRVSERQQTFAELGRLALIALWLCAFANAVSAQPRAPGATVVEDRLALVIGNAAYASDPLDNPINDARLIAEVLQKAGFKVTRRENLDRTRLVNAFREFGDRLNETTIAVVYYAGHALQLRDQNFLVPIDAEIRNEDEIPLAGVDVGFVLGRMSHAKSRINIVILDACRNNPFAGKTRPARGLAQMDAPVGTLLAFATAPGKVAEDGTGLNNSIYTAHLAKHLLSPGLPVESMFKRVREGVLKDTNRQQVPWESSSLLGEFAFVPGIAATAVADAEQEAAGEIAFWNSIQAAARADEYRAYLRQYPRGRFAELAQTRIAAFARDAAKTATLATALPPVSPPSAANTLVERSPVATGMGGRPELLPRVGDTWRYRIADQFRLGDLFLTATVADVATRGVTETWTTTSDANVRTTLVPLEAGFSALPGWNLTPPEFAPYLLAAGPLRAGEKIGGQKRTIDRAVVPLQAAIVGEEDVVVAAGRFRATKMTLRGQAQARGPRAGPIAVEHIVWYAPDVKRFVKYTVSTRVGGSLQEETLFELMDYKLN